MDALVFFILSLCSFYSASSTEESKSSTSFSNDLTHYDSPLSPFYNTSMIQSKHLRNAALCSNAQINRTSLSLSTKENKKSLESIIIPNSGDYLMRIYIGTPPLEMLAIVHTGSDLTWLQCFPCFRCGRKNTPIYDRSKSSTFKNISCDSRNCTLLPPRQKYCGTLGECLYSYHYDEKFTVGHLGIDSINLGGDITFPKFIFGCGYYNVMKFKTGKAMGVLGLGPGPLSLVSQLGNEIGHKFSYCLVDPSNSSTNSKLKFGNESMILGNGVVYSTPLITKSSFYFLNLEGISVGRKIVKTSQKKIGNIIIDSGTTLTYLEENIYNNLVVLMKEVIGVEVVQDVPSPFQFCFTHQHGMNFPEVVFHFTGANITMKTKNLLFMFDNNLHCLAIVPTTPAKYNGISIFGNVAQIDFQVEYDLEERKVSFAPTDCKKN